MQIMIYVITTRLFLMISMYSNDSKVTSSFISMDVSRLGSNIIQIYKKKYKYAHQYAN